MRNRIEKHLVQTCEIISPTRNEFGDYLDSGSNTTESCRFREISTMRRQTHAEISDADAMLWLKQDTVARDGSIIKFDGVYYQVERFTRARKLGKTTVEFVKCDLKITDTGIS